MWWRRRNVPESVSARKSLVSQPLRHHTLVQQGKKLRDQHLCRRSRDMQKKKENARVCRMRTSNLAMFSSNFQGITISRPTQTVNRAWHMCLLSDWDGMPFCRHGTCPPHDRTKRHRCGVPSWHNSIASKNATAGDIDAKGDNWKGVAIGGFATQARMDTINRKQRCYCHLAGVATSVSMFVLQCKGENKNPKSMRGLKKCGQKWKKSRS